MPAAGAVRRQKDYGYVAGSITASNQLGGFQTVKVRHVNVHEDDRDFIVQKIPERIVARSRTYQISVGSFQYRLQRQQVCRAVVNHQNVDLFFSFHNGPPRR